MKVSSMLRTFAAAALVVAMVPAVHGEEKKVVKRTIIVKDGQVYTSNNDDASSLRGGVMVRRGYLGVNLLEITPELRDHYRVSKDSGVLVSRVESDSPAAKAGIHTGDVITAVDGARVDSPGDVARAVRNKKNGESARIEYSRDGARSVAVASIMERERPQIDLSEITDHIGDITANIGDVGKRLEEHFNSPEWKAKMEKLGDCGRMQSRLQELETRLKDLEKKLR